MSEKLIFKLVISGLLSVIIVGLLFVNPKADNRGPSWSYIGGKNDPFYWGLFAGDGSLRSYVKPMLITCFSIGLLVLWVFL